MAYVYDIVNPTQLQSFVRNIDPRTLNYTLNALLPDQMRQTTEYEFMTMTEVRDEIAMYRAWDTPPPIIGRPGATKQKGAIPPGSVKRLLTEQNRIEMEKLRGFSNELVNTIFDDSRAVTNSVLGRLELARGEALTRGQVSFTTDRGYTGVTISYGATTTITAPSVKWDVPATAQPIQDMQAQLLQYANANNGARPAFGLVSQSVIDYITACASVKAALASQGTVPAIVPQDDLMAALRRFGIPPLVAYDVSVNVAGTTTRVTGVKELTWLPPPSIDNFGEVTHGITAESLELVGSNYLTMETAPGVTVMIDKTTQPTQLHTVATFVSVPVIKDTAKIGNVTVLT